MATDPRNGAQILTNEECWQRLHANSLGRLAVSVGEVPDIFPINYALVEESIILRTTEGSKLASIAVNRRIAFEIDGLDEPTNVAWSVVLHGIAEIIEHSALEAKIESLPWFPWNVAPKNRFVQLTANDVSGRAFVAHARVK